MKMKSEHKTLCAPEARTRYDAALCDPPDLVFAVVCLNQLDVARLQHPSANGNKGSPRTLIPSRGSAQTAHHHNPIAENATNRKTTAQVGKRLDAKSKHHDSLYRRVPTPHCCVALLNVLCQTLILRQTANAQSWKELRSGHHLCTARRMGISRQIDVAPKGPVPLVPRLLHRHTVCCCSMHPTECGRRARQNVTISTGQTTANRNTLTGVE